MVQPYKLHINFKDFKANYKLELNNYLEVFENSNEDEFVSLLKKKYDNQKEAVEDLENSIFPKVTLLSIGLSDLKANPKIPKSHHEKLYYECFGVEDEPLFNEAAYVRLIKETNNILNDLLSAIDNKEWFDTEEKKQLRFKYIDEHKHQDFIRINKKFLKYWNNNKFNKDLIYYLYYLIDKEYFRKVIAGNKFKSTHGKDFLSLYYFNDKLALSEAKRKYFNKIKSKNYHLYLSLNN